MLLSLFHYLFLNKWFSACVDEHLDEWIAGNSVDTVQRFTSMSFTDHYLLSSKINLKMVILCQK